MLDKVRAAINSRKVRDVYKEVLNKNLNSNCDSCIRDAIYELQIWLNQQERMNSDIILFTSKYESPNKQRQKELEIVAEQNVLNPHIKQVVNVEGRNFSDFFKAMEAFPDSVNIIANSDIFFDNTLHEAKKIKPNECYALSRYDYGGNGHAKLYNHKDSQDAWIFRGVPKNVYGDFSLGKPGCDNRIAYEIKKAGYQITNPAYSIHAIHYHLSNFRTTAKFGSEPVPPPYLLLDLV